MNILIYRDNWNPIYEFVEDKTSHPIGLKIEPDKVEKWKKVFEDFDNLQDELKKLYYENYKAFHRV